MPTATWALALSVLVGSGQLLGFDLPWPWEYALDSFGKLESEGGDSKVSDNIPDFESQGAGGHTGPDTTGEHSAEGTAHIGGYSVLHFDVRSWIGPSWFSTPQTAGTLSSSGGWGLYFLDKIGVLTCGDFWPWVAWGGLLLLFTVGAILILYVLTVICRPCKHFCTCCCRQTRVVAQEVGELLPELRLGGTYERLEVKGPASRAGVDTEFFQRGVKGRGSERKPNDVAVILEGQIARLKVDGDHWARVDRHGLWVRLREVKGSTSRPLRVRLEQEGRVHLCRELRCPLELAPTPGLHCKTYAIIDANGSVDLGAYAGWTTRRMVVLLARGARWIGRLIGKCIYYLTGWFLLRQLWDVRRPSRVIQEGSLMRPLDPESESEAEVQEDPCEAVLVGLEHGGKPRALATDPCGDRASGEGIRLLERDRELSDVKGRTSVRLCDHHRQLYIAACSGRKCSVLSCYDQVDGAKQGVPLCKHHLLEIGSGARPSRRVSWGSERDARSVGPEASASEAESPARNGRSRHVTRENSLTETKKVRSASAEPKSEKQRQLEGKLETGLCLVLLRPKSLQKPDLPPRWIAFLGCIEGFAFEGKAQELLLIQLSNLGRTCCVHRSRILDAPPESGSGRLSRRWVEEFLTGSHEDAVAEGISILVSRITDNQAAALHQWDGESTDDRPKPVGSWRQKLRGEILPHAEAYLKEGEPAEEDFMTPPRPRGSKENAEPLPDIPAFPDLDDSDLQGRIEAAKRTLKQHASEGALDAETLQMVAAAFDLDPAHLQLEVSETKGSPSLRVRPPGLDMQELDEPQPDQGQNTPVPGGALIMPASRRPENPLLKRGSLPAQSAGGLSLFPRGTLERRGLVKPAQNSTEGRAGASFGETLGEGTQTQQTDRIIHAIDGLRKAQDDDKTLQKGSLSSIKEAEKMDVYLARGCGTLTIEIAPGVYGKELLHAGKRIAQHARHMLHLIKWPVLMTNRLLLGIAGLWWGGKDTYTIHARPLAPSSSIVGILLQTTSQSPEFDRLESSIPG